MRYAWRRFWWWFTKPTGEWMGLPQYTRPKPDWWRGA